MSSGPRLLASSRSRVLVSSTADPSGDVAVARLSWKLRSAWSGTLPRIARITAGVLAALPGWGTLSVVFQGGGIPYVELQAGGIPVICRVSGLMQTPSAVFQDELVPSVLSSVEE